MVICTVTLPTVPVRSFHSNMGEDKSRLPAQPPDVATSHVVFIERCSGEVPTLSHLMSLSTIGIISYSNARCVLLCKTGIVARKQHKIGPSSFTFGWREEMVQHGTCLVLWDRSINEELQYTLQTGWIVGGVERERHCCQLRASLRTNITIFLDYESDLFCPSYCAIKV